jgi:hypothetical protein
MPQYEDLAGHFEIVISMNIHAVNFRALDGVV